LGFTGAKNVMNDLPDELIVDICNLIDPERDIAVIHRCVSVNKELVALSSTCTRLRRICWPRTFYNLRLSRKTNLAHILASSNDQYWDTTRYVWARSVLTGIRLRLIGLSFSKFKIGSHLPRRWR